MVRRGHSGLNKAEAEKVMSEEVMESEPVRAAIEAANSAAEAKAELAEGEVSAAISDERDAVDLEKNVERSATTKYVKAAAKKGTKKAREAVVALQGVEEGHWAKSKAAPIVSVAKTATKETEYDAIREVSGVHVGHSKKRSANRKRAHSRSSSKSPKARKTSKRSPSKKSPKKLSRWQAHVKAFAKEHKGKYEFSEMMKAAAEHWKKSKAMSQEY